MDTEPLVAETLADGQKLVERLTQEGFEITVAFWVMPSELGKWHFYIVTPLVESEGIFQANLQLVLAMRRIPPGSIGPLMVRLIGPSNPMARDALAVLQGPYGLRVPPPLWLGRQLGDLIIEGAYIYPIPKTTP